MQSRVDEIASGQPWEEKTVKALWFHLMREMVQGGEIARVGTVPFAVYCVVKSHTSLETGDAFPSNARIAALVGVSLDTVQRSLKKLAEAGLISATKKRGRGSSYSVIEKIPLEEKSGEPWATGERKYIPLQFSGFVEELQRLARTGNLPTDKTININLVVQNITQGDHSVVNGIVNSPESLPPPSIDKPVV